MWIQLLNVTDLGLDVFSDVAGRHVLHSVEILHNFTKVVSSV